MDFSSKLLLSSKKIKKSLHINKLNKKEEIENLFEEEQDKKLEEIPELCLGLLTEEQAEYLEKKYPNCLTKKQLMQLDKYGVLVIPNILDKQEQLQAINELWDVLENVPHKPEHRIYRPQNPLGSISRQQQKTYSRNWVPWKSYGMLSESGVFHTQTLWNLRQSEKLYTIFNQLLGTEKLWASIDRASVKLPNQGEEEFNHWDFDPWHPVKSTIQGIVNLSERNFRCVPGSNTVKWHEDFKKEYTYLSSDKPRSSVQIQKDKDPWNLGQILDLYSFGKSKTPYNCIRNITCPPGSMILFSQRTMHSVAKNKSDKISYGLYLTFIEAGNKLTHAVHKKRVSNIHAVEGHTERADRIRSYWQGTAPYKFACGAGIFSYIIWRTINVYMKKREEASFIPHPTTGNLSIFEPLPKNYQPPELTKLGRLVLGLDLYPGMEQQATVLSQEDIRKLNQK